MFHIVGVDHFNDGVNLFVGIFYGQGDKYGPGVGMVRVLMVRKDNGGIRVVRMGLQASAELDRGGTVLDGPYHAAFGQLVISKLFLDGVCRALEGPDRTPDTISIAVHPRSVSNLRGQKNLNLEKFQHRFPYHRFEVRTDQKLDEMEFAVNGMEPVSILD